MPAAAYLTLQRVDKTVKHAADLFGIPNEDRRFVGVDNLNPLSQFHLGLELVV